VKKNEGNILKQTLIVIVGATGSGKTDLSIRIALHYGAPIISTDSRQFYQGLKIGTAQPDDNQLQLIEHHFIASHHLNQHFNCGEYETEALAVLEKLFSHHDYVVAAGGSGLYVRALCEGLDDLPQADDTLRTELTQRLEKEGIDSLTEQLKNLDPDYYQSVDRSNPARIMRALEVCLQSGLPYSQLRTGVKRERNFEIIKIGIDLPRAELYKRIDCRVDRMLAEGLEDEAREMYPYRHLNALQTVGYREFFDYFDGKTSYAEAVELIKRNSRRYAKRQLTWFRRDREIRWFHPAAIKEIIRYIDFGE
jgi:tRNA dimethylallyltransferase